MNNLEGKVVIEKAMSRMHGKVIRLREKFNLEMARNEAEHRINWINNLPKPRAGNARAIFAKLCRLQIAIIRLRISEASLEQKYTSRKLLLAKTYPQCRQINLPHHARIQAGISQKTRLLADRLAKFPSYNKASGSLLQRCESLIRDAQIVSPGPAFPRQSYTPAKPEHAANCSTSD